jgi:ATP adenylyltransferase
MWAPWRFGYVTGERPDDCVFCAKINSDEDAENHILHRGEHCVIMLNRYPYNSGHLMVVPNEHVGDICDLTADAADELWALTGVAVETVRRALKAQGINLGMNLGEAAGAGICDHIHMHIVPRWSGDTNYMTTVSQTRVVPQSLEDSYNQLRPVVEELISSGDEG